MVFNELYSVYYNTVAKILTRALEPDVTEQALQQEVLDHAFSESVLTILPALKSGKWQLLHDDLTPVVHHVPTMPLSTLQKRWIKSLEDDPRLRLFEVTLPDLDDVAPLFTREDYRVYDQYADGDPFDDPQYIAHFRVLRQAIREKRPVKVTMDNRQNRRVRMRFYPKGFEYSLKDDKIRVLVTNCRFRYVNLGRIQSCSFYHGDVPWRAKPEAEQRRPLVLEICNERNTLERAMLHFAHFEKQAERIDDTHYRLRLQYYESDETEIVIRVLSFGPYVKVIEPESFVELIKKRLISQKSCELK
ncbi:MAG: WYL domain-containing protein [Faecousia sp.]